MSDWAVVLAGGSGTRFWPLSTPARPKQFLPLTGTASLLEQAVARLDGLIDPERILVVTSERLRDATHALLGSVPAENILGEPRAASTAPALSWASFLVQSRDPAATIVSLHADWHIGDGAAFRQTARTAMEVARRHDRLVTVGIVPTRPDAGYGYIQPGSALDGDSREVARFIEKPDAETARGLIEGGALWNSGLFAWTVMRFFQETASIAPEIAPHLRLLEAGNVPAFFSAVTPVAIDVSHFERSERVALVPGAFPWDDVGTWGALSRARPTDADGNVVVGSAALRDVAQSVVWAGDGPVVLDGVQDLVVVRANGMTLVTTRERAAQLKDLLESLPESMRDLPS